ncbi:MAG: FxsA family protein [Thiotrichaceae bacterium]|nr:FxsA family protein [Thiotrichaceae bacterium]
MTTVKPFPRFAILFLIIPLVEIYFLVKVGGSIGAFQTILLIIATAVIGVMLLRQQGMVALGRLQKNIMEGHLPAGDVLDGIILLVGGALLLLPGFFTDTLGFLCLIPFSRQLISGWISKNTSIQSHMKSSSFESTRDQVIDGEFVRKPEARISKD